MKPKFDPGDQEAVEHSRRLFGAFHRLEQLTSGDTPAGGRLSFATLYAYVREAETDPEVEAALKESASLRADYRRLVEKFSAPFIPLAIAADTGAPSVREGVGCRCGYDCRSPQRVR